MHTVYKTRRCILLHMLYCIVLNCIVRKMSKGTIWTHVIDQRYYILAKPAEQCFVGPHNFMDTLKQCGTTVTIHKQS